MTLHTEMLGEGASDARRFVHVERDQTRAVLTLCDPERLNPLSAGLTSSSRPTSWTWPPTRPCPPSTRRLNTHQPKVGLAELTLGGIVGQ